MGRRLATLLGLAVVATPVFAHHPLGGMVPTNLVDGLLSGVGHPIIGLDHLAFVLLAGILGGLLGRVFALPLAFVAGTLGGTLLRAGGVAIPGTEFLVAASVFGVALYVVATQPKALVALATLSLSGLAHGLAYGATVIGAESTPVIAYLVALAVVQGLIGIAAALATRATRAVEARAVAPRLAAAAIAGIGFVHLFEMVEGALIA